MEFAAKLGMVLDGPKVVIVCPIGDSSMGTVISLQKKWKNKPFSGSIGSSTDSIYRCMNDAEDVLNSNSIPRLTESLFIEQFIVMERS